MGVLEDVILVRAWEAFGRRGGDLACMLCERETDMYALPDDDGATGQMLVDANLRVLCLECAAENGIEGDVGQCITIEISVKKAKSCSTN